MCPKHVLIGNGININFGGRDYTNGQIIERLSMKLKQNDGYYDDVFAGVVSSDELLGIIEGLNDIFNKMLNGSILSLRRAANEEEMRTLIDISRRYEMKKHSAVEIGMEDYFFALKWFNNAYSDSEEITRPAFQGLKQLFLDSIFNNGEIEKLYLKMQPFSQELEQFDTIFTVNYDTNLDKLSKKKVYHLHGSFAELDNSYIPTTIVGIVASMKKSKPRVIAGKEHLFCNAIMGYSGDYKYDQMMQYKKINSSLRDNSLKAYEYPIEEFQSICGELHIIGMSPNNDSHILSMINGNPDISNVVFYCVDDTAFEEAKKVIMKPITMRNVIEYWNSLQKI